MSIKRKVLNILLLFSIKLKSIFYSKKIFLLGTPIHGNLGDLAILYSEIKFFKEKFGVKVIEVESFLLQTKFKEIKKIIGEEKIFVHGGGFLGTTWPEEENNFRTIIEGFKENRIIVFPQTIYFAPNQEEVEKKSIQIYSSHKKITFFCREIYSFNYIKTKLPDCDSYLVPDIVLYNDPFDFRYQRSDVLFCLRNDREKVQRSYKLIESKILEKGLNIHYTDTVVDKVILSFSREKELLKMWRQISKHKIMVTDRLHGMVFAYITMTPCIVFENSNYKVKGLYEWIKDCNFIKFYDEKTLDDDLKDLFNIKEIECNRDIKNEFKDLIECIKDGE